MRSFRLDFSVVNVRGIIQCMIILKRRKTYLNVLCKYFSLHFPYKHFFFTNATFFLIFLSSLSDVTFGLFKSTFYYFSSCLQSLSSQKSRPTLSFYCHKIMHMYLFKRLNHAMSRDQRQYVVYALVNVHI